MKNKVRRILADLNNCDERNLKDNIVDRLDKSLKLYTDELNNSYTNVINNDDKTIIKELNKRS